MGWKGQWCPGQSTKRPTVNIYGALEIGKKKTSSAGHSTCAENTQESVTDHLCNQRQAPNPSPRKVVPNEGTQRVPPEGGTRAGLLAGGERTSVGCGREFPRELQAAGRADTPHVCPCPRCGSQVTRERLPHVLVPGWDERGFSPSAPLAVTAAGSQPVAGTAHPGGARSTGRRAHVAPRSPGCTWELLAVSLRGHRGANSAHCPLGRAPGAQGPACHPRRAF